MVLIKYAGKVLKGATNRAVEDVVLLAKLFKNRAGLSKSQSGMVKFTEIFPWNVLALFVFFLLILVGINYAVKYIVNSAVLPEAEVTKLKNSKKSWLEKKAWAMAQIENTNSDMFTSNVASQTYAQAETQLEEIDRQLKAPEQLQSDIMTVLSLTIAIAGIFSLPLLTAATFKLMANRLVAAKSAMESSESELVQ